MSDLYATSQSYAPGTLEDVDRALSELRRGWPVLLHSSDGAALLVLAAEAANDERLRALDRSGEGARALVLTGPRAQALSLTEMEAEGPVRLPAAGLSAGTISALADPTAIARPVTPTPPALLPAEELEVAAVELVKLARLLPAVLVAAAPVTDEPAAWAAKKGFLSVTAQEVEAYRTAAAHSLTKVAEAAVPLSDAEDTRILAFRPADGGIEHLAIVIGRLDTSQPVLVRLHSECFTGDLLGSLRCDCGDQLRGAIQTIAAAGSGVLLYLAQEGRGIGLVNKLRAYTLQDRGADTHEANLQLGFDADERVYLPAAEMLRQLGVQQVRLMTNNPEKLEQLARWGIAVTERVQHSFPSNGHNEAYLATKATKFGHLL
ncbi:GTP cyclohydrolase II [Algihabitans albus]|uniref:GTP cyclohydrolase II n=1 Tax=Algihabitans albus TaxID=2164067 RepID=UPI000E5CC2D1|nr:GTP cyclohydrolase II [Algihabitans albus]